MNVRAKFRCDERAETFWGSTRYKFSAVYDTTTEENRRFSTSTPTGTLEINVNNPAVSFTVGDFYYLDFTPEKVEAAEPIAAS